MRCIFRIFTCLTVLVAFDAASIANTDTAGSSLQEDVTNLAAETDGEATAESTSLQINQQDLAKLMQAAAAEYTLREKNPTLEKAISLYKEALAKDAENFEALWCLSRCYWWAGDHSPRKKQIELFDAGKITAQHVQKVRPDKVEGYYWFGVCEGRAAEVRGVLNSLFAVGGIKDAMQKTIALDKEHGLAHHVLGVLYRKAPGWPLSCGNMNKSLEHAILAVKFAPEEIITRVGLAKTLIAQNKKAEAKPLLEEALALPGPVDKQPETKKDKVEAKRILVSLQKP